MRVAIRNLHRTGIGGKHPFHDYILGLIQSGVITHLFFENISWRDPALQAIRKKYHASELGLTRAKFIFTSEELNKECDVLISFDSRPEDFSEAVRQFPGLKVYHLMDYFWGEPLTEKLSRLEAHGVQYLLSYGSPDRYCPYFTAHGTAYSGKVIPLPFGFGTRFVATTSFKDRIHRCIALGSVRPLRFEKEDPRKFEEQALAFPGEVWFHKFRRMLVEHRTDLNDCMDSLLPEFPRYRDYDYDLVSKLNEYQMFVSDESLFFFPSAKAFEGPAAGTVMVCSDHPCFADYGFTDGVTCVTHREFDIDDFHRKTKGALADQDRLGRIAAAGEAFVRARYSHSQIGHTLAHILTEVYTAKKEHKDLGNLASFCYDKYRNPEEYRPVSTASKRLSYLAWYVLGGAIYCILMDALVLPQRFIAKIRRLLYPYKKKASDGLRRFANREPAQDRGRRAKFTAIVPELDAPSLAEEERIARLRSDFAVLPQPTDAGTAPERKWARFVAELRKKIADEDPRTFLSWEVIRNNMGYRAGGAELEMLTRQNDWARWKQAITEPLMTRREPFYLFPEANENTIRQAYHLAEFRRVTEADVTDFDTIVDFGGGYGSMCRLVHALGFTGTYVIYDWKEFSLLQRFYLALTGTPAPLQANTLEELAAHLKVREGKTLLIATWSLSEVSPALRDSILEIVQPDAYLLSYQKEFGGIDNECYFSTLRTRYPKIQWHQFPMTYLPTERNKYLIGTHE